MPPARLEGGALQDEEIGELPNTVGAETPMPSPRTSTSRTPSKGQLASPRAASTGQLRNSKSDVEREEWHHERSALRTTSKLSSMSSMSKHSAVAQVVQAVKRKVDPFTATVMSGGSVLALCAGMVNVIAFHALSRFVSHVTGTFSRGAVHAGSEAWEEAGQSVLLVLAFVFGSMVCGCMIAKSTVTFDTPLYGVVLLMNAALLVVTFLTSDHDVAPYMVAIACGLQNGMATSYSGAVIRTTHVTGLFTDVGLIIGRTCLVMIKKRLGRAGVISQAVHPIEELRKLTLLLILATSFFLGVVFGSLLHAEVGNEAFLVPAAITGASGAYYTMFRLFCPHKAPHQVETWGDTWDELSPKLPRAFSAKWSEHVSRRSVSGNGDRSLHTVTEDGSEHDEPDAEATPDAGRGVRSPEESEDSFVNITGPKQAASKHSTSANDSARDEPVRAEALQNILHMLDTMEAPIGELSSQQQEHDSVWEARNAHHALRARVLELAEAMGVPTQNAQRTGGSPWKQ